MDIVKRLREHNEPPFDYIAHEAADMIEWLRNNQSIIIASFRVNMMRLCPDYSPEEFDKDIADIVGEKG